MHRDCWIQRVITRVGAVTCWIQQSVSPKQVVGFTCVFNSEIDQLIRKALVPRPCSNSFPRALSPVLRTPSRIPSRNASRESSVPSVAKINEEIKIEMKNENEK